MLKMLLLPPSQIYAGWIEMDIRDDLLHLGVFSFERKRNKQERKTYKLINELRLILVQIHSSIYVFFSLSYFSLSNQTHP
jgi:hypothetical protein